MTIEKDRHIIRKNGKVVGTAFGHVSQHEGETVDFVDLDSEIEADEPVKRRRGCIHAQNRLADCKAANRAQAFALKTLTARQFIKDDPPELPVDDPDVIDAELYPELYDEYWATYRFSPMTAKELATSINSRAATESLAESRRREIILISEATINDYESD